MSTFKKIVVRERDELHFMKNNEKTIHSFDEKYRKLVANVARKHGVKLDDKYESTSELYEAFEANGVKFESPNGHYVTMKVNGVDTLLMLQSHKIHRDGISMILEYCEL